LNEISKLGQGLKDCLDVMVATVDGMSDPKDGRILGVEVFVAVYQIDLDNFETVGGPVSLHGSSQFFYLVSQSVCQAFATNVKLDHAGVGINVINGDKQAFYLLEVPGADEVKKLIAATWG